MNIVDARPPLRFPPTIDPLMLLISIIYFLDVSSWLMLVINCFRSIALLDSNDYSSSSLLANNFDTLSKLFFCSFTKPYKPSIVFFSVYTSVNLIDLLWVYKTADKLCSLSSANKVSLSAYKFLTIYAWLLSLDLSCCLSYCNCFSIFSILLLWFSFVDTSYSYFWRYSWIFALSYVFYFV